MMSPFAAVAQEVAVADLALRHAAGELNRSQSRRRRHRAGRRWLDRRR